MIVAIDIGTSSVKTALMDFEGHIAKECTQPVNLHMPEPGAAEHDLDEILKNIFKCLKLVVKGFEKKVEALSFSCYLHGLALLDQKLNPLTGVLTHLDTRSAIYQDEVSAHGQKLYMRTGCPPIFVYPLTKLMWARARGFLEKAHAISFVKDYVIYKLAGIRALDYGTASGTGLMNIHKLKWDSLALEIANVDEKILPEIVEGAKVLDYKSFPDLGLEKTAVVLGSFDGALQNIGYSVYEDEGVINLGSTAVIRILKKDVVLDKREEMRFFCYYGADGYRTIGAASNNGMTFLEWIRENIVKSSQWNEFLKMIKEVKACSENVYVLPFISGERFPFRDPYLRLTILGVEVHHKVSHIARAAIEGVGYTLKTALNAMEENGIVIKSLHCGGGGCNLLEVVKIISNILDKPITLYSGDVMRMASALGAMIVAIRALNYVNDIAKAKLDVIIKSQADVISPEAQLKNVYEKCYEKFLIYVKELAKTYKSIYKL
ncbi:gluconokinase [Ignisphaera sp. 4213-co]|uniref:Gluconokinase n=1 Tax=Ignisphaera cupida TaxID=3050454 RepID=A0ABD4Z8W4_9CREN|nr:gluconokinase [Ignisphaera sp. 4213-co]MDK6029149.1 gluconokinase [Ignisphaera sp. 4213-co]